MDRKGFTLVELLIVMTLLGFVVLFTARIFALQDQRGTERSMQLRKGFAAIEESFKLYVVEQKAAPSGLADASFIGPYLRLPRLPKGFDASYGASGWVLAHHSGAGRALTVRVNVANSNDMLWLAATKAQDAAPHGKISLSVVAGSKTNMAPPAGATTVHVNWWITHE